MRSLALEFFAGDAGDPEDFAGAAFGVVAGEGGAPGHAFGAAGFDEVAFEGDEFVAFHGEELAADVGVGREAVGVGGVLRDLFGFERRLVFPTIEIEAAVLGDFESVDGVGCGHGAPAEGEVERAEIGERGEAVAFAAEDDGGDLVLREWLDGVFAVTERGGKAG